MSDWGQSLADALKGLFWLLGIMAGALVVAVVVIVWLLVTR